MRIVFDIAGTLTDYNRFVQKEQLSILNPSITWKWLMRMLWR